MSRRERSGLLLAAALSAVLLLLTWGSYLADEPLRRELEARMNQSMHGYTVQLGYAHGGPLRLSLTLRNVVVRQRAFPEPPVAVIPKLHMSVEWHELLFRHLVGDAYFERPHLHLNIPQLHVETLRKLRMGERGWQAALQSIYPLKFNTMRVIDGTLTYVDGDPSRPLEISHWMLEATNLRNLHFPDRVYPSPVHTEGVIFGTGRGLVVGNANFLDDPFPGWHARYRLDEVPLERLQQFGQSFQLHQGQLSSYGQLEYAPRIKVVDVANVELSGVALDYVHTAAGAEAERRRAEQIKAVAKEAEESPVVMRLDRLHLAGGQVGYVNRATHPPYRLYVDRASFELLNLSNRIAGLRQHGAVCHLSGRFMGSEGGGAVKAEATFRPGSPAADFGAELAIEHAKLPAFNDMLGAYGKPEAAGGDVSIYSQITGKNRQLHGYVKALFDDVKLYDPRKDRNKSLATKLEERVIGGLAELLENKKSDALVIRTEITGELGAPRTNTGEMLGVLLRNAFVKAVAPGFERPSHAHSSKGG